MNFVLNLYIKGSPTPKPPQPGVPIPVSKTYELKIGPEKTLIAQGLKPVGCNVDSMGRYESPITLETIQGDSVIGLQEEGRIHIVDRDSLVRLNRVNEDGYDSYLTSKGLDATNLYEITGVRSSNETGEDLVLEGKLFNPNERTPYEQKMDSYIHNLGSVVATAKGAGAVGVAGVVGAGAGAVGVAGVVGVGAGVVGAGVVIVAGAVSAAVVAGAGGAGVVVGVGAAVAGEEAVAVVAGAVGAGVVVGAAVAGAEAVAGAVGVAVSGGVAGAVGAGLIGAGVGAVAGTAAAGLIGAGVGGVVTRAIYNGNTVWGLCDEDDVTQFQEQCKTEGKTFIEQQQKIKTD
ncbi:hypothetical protein OAJ27_01065 [bacterium]|nr:hypothetical protein [bacterium]